MAAEESPRDSRYKKYFSIFARVSKQIHSNTRTPDILASIVENITLILRAKGAIFWILNTRDQTIQTKISHGFDYQSLSRVDFPTLMTLFPPDTPGPISIRDARNDKRIPDLERLGKHLINAVTGQYFDISGPYKGLLAVYFIGDRSLEDHELELLNALGEQGAIALEKALGHDRQMLDLYREIIQGFALAIEARDPVTHGHSLGVASLARATALEMGLGPDEAGQIYDAAIVHDIGKIGTKDRILDRLGKLNKKELSAIREHPVLGARILAPLSCMGDIQSLVRSHHELFNGNGYPDGKKGDQIPLGARILAVCDAFETMRSGRPGMPGKDLASALNSLKLGAGTRFDPGVVQAFFDLMRKDPNILDTKESIDHCLDILTQNIGRMADQNRMEQKLSNPFSDFF